jgi:DNA-binding CsgD family transcriptional regulator
MVRMTGKDYRDILNLVYLANRCEDVKSFVDALFPSITQAFNVECATFQLIKGYPQHITIVESRSFKSDNRNLYEDKYYPILYKDSFYQLSPLLKEATSSSKTVLKFGESISIRDWERSDFYNNFMLPQNLFWELFLTLRWKNNLEGMITLWRSKKQPDYEDKEVLKAARLASHLGVVVHNIRLVSQINTRESHFLSADEADGEGLLWLDRKFTPSLSNLTDEQKLETAFQTRFQLSRRELDVIYYLIKGLSDNEIGEKLYISRQTVHTHTKNIYKKLGAKSRIELYRRVIQSRYPGISNHPTLLT